MEWKNQSFIGKTKEVKMTNSSISGLTHTLSVKYPLVTSGYIHHRVILSGNEGAKDDQRGLGQTTTASKTWIYKKMLNFKIKIIKTGKW